mgnify:CR=1
MSRQTERIGRSGEYLACSCIARETDTVTIMPHGSHADIVFEWNMTMYRCQVKTVTHIEKKRVSWRFDLRKGSHSNQRRYVDNMIDLYALVNLKYQNIYFLPYKDCKKLQFSIDDNIMKSTNSTDSLYKAMFGITGATISRLPKNVIHFASAKISING